ncbi:MAG: hypothetical protein R2873_14620 [Caldilineaceae bacterium]
MANTAPARGRSITDPTAVGSANSTRPPGASQNQPYDQHHADQAQRQEPGTGVVAPTAKEPTQRRRQKDRQRNRHVRPKLRRCAADHPDQGAHRHQATHHQPQRNPHFRHKVGVWRD